MFAQMNHQIPHMGSQLPMYPNAAQQQPSSVMYPKQMVPQQYQNVQVHNQFVEAEQQIQQEILQLQQLQLQLKLRQQQFVHNFNSAGMPVPPMNSTNVNGYMPQQYNPHMVSQMNAQHGYNPYHSGMMGMEGQDPNMHMMPAHQMCLNNDLAQPQSMMQYNKFLPSPQMQMGPNGEQLPMNRKRGYNISTQYSKLEDSNETHSPENVNFINKKLCTEDMKSSTTLRDSNSFTQKHANYQNAMNFMPGQNPRMFHNNQMQKFNSDASSTQSIRNKQSSINTFGMDISFQSNSASVNNTFIIKKEAKNEMNISSDKADLHRDMEINSDNQDSNDKRCKKEIQNDSNYTKNLLKGFRRHMNKKFKDNKETIEKFQQYFYNNTLSNEFILILLESSTYQVEFDEFLATDPSWWIKEAKIKEPQRQLKFFETVKNKNYSDIRTKRKGKAATSTTTPQSQDSTIPAANGTENVVESNIETAKETENTEQKISTETTEVAENNTTVTPIVAAENTETENNNNTTTTTTITPSTETTTPNQQ